MAFYISHVLSKLDEVLRDTTLTSRARREIGAIRKDIGSLLPWCQHAQRKYLIMSEDDEAAKEFTGKFGDAIDELEKLVDDYLLNEAETASASSQQAKLFRRFFDSRRRANKIAVMREPFRHIAEREKGRWQALPSFRDKVLRDSSVALETRLSETDDFISFDRSAEELIDQLVDRNLPSRTVLSILGPSGVGKTALAQHVYNHREIAKHFDARCRIVVLDTDGTLDLLKRILKGLIGLSDVIMVGMNEQEIKSKISNHLRTQRYLIVIDGELGMEDWSSIVEAFPKEPNGSRVVVVADEFEGADITKKMSYLTEEQNWELFCRKAFDGGVCPQDLLLFKEVVDGTCQGLPLATVLLAGLLRSREPSSEEWGKVLNYYRNRKKEGAKQSQREEEENNYKRETKIEEQVPVEVGENSNYKKETEEEQQETKEEEYNYSIETQGEKQEPVKQEESGDCNKERQEEQQEPEQEEENSNHSIEHQEEEKESKREEGSSSYNREAEEEKQESQEGGFRGSSVFEILFSELPNDLMLCFCYLAAYPMNSSIDAQDLMQLWIAEGLIAEADENQSLTMEDLAVRYLHGLISMSLAQLLDQDEFGHVMLIRIQPTMHNFVRSMSEGFELLHTDVTSGNNPHRLSLHSGIKDYLSSLADNTDHKYLQTLLCMSSEGLRLSEELNLWNTKLLKIIDLQGIRLKNLPEHIGFLIHLRYLCLRNTCLTTLPSSIGKLQDLRMLDLRGTRVAKIVESFWNIRSLRHVYVPVHFFGSEPSPCNNLDNLQTLDGVLSGSWVNKLAMMSNLRRLTMVNVSISNEAALGDAIEKLKHLRSLKLEGKSLPAKVFKKTEAPGEGATLADLEEMELSGPLGSRPWILNNENYRVLPNLTVLRLINAGLGQDDINMLSKLHELRSLALWKSYSKGKMEFTSNSFPSLKELDLLSLTELEELVIDATAMPNLERLTITSCKLKKLPDDWVRNNLKNISTRNVPITDKYLQEYLRVNHKKLGRAPSIFRH